MWSIWGLRAGARDMRLSTLWGCRMICMGKNIANCSKIPQFLHVICVLCARCARMPPVAAQILWSCLSVHALPCAMLNMLLFLHGLKVHKI